MASDISGIATRPEGANVAFLLIHGFCASADELATLGRYLAENGHASFAVQLDGHGTSPEDLKSTSWHDWYISTKKGLEVVRSWNMEFIFVIGFSMGGILSILLASEESDIDGLVLIAPALKISGILPKLVPILKYFVKYREINLEVVQQVYDVKRTKYAREPVSAYQEFFKLQKVANKKLQDIKIPSIVIQGEEDKTIDISSGRIAFEGISSTKKSIHLIKGAEHVISCHPTRSIAYPIILEFVESITN